MIRPIHLLIGLLLVTLLWIAPPLSAGGWAVVSLDSLPQKIRAGERIELGFTVLQHGQTPVEQTVDEHGRPTPPLLTALHLDSGQQLRAEARQEGEVGHFVVEVTFPSEGRWEWEITAPPFGPTEFEPLVVLPAGGAAPTLLMQNVPLPDRSLLRVAAAALLLVSLVTYLARRRPSRRPLRDQPLQGESG